MRSIADFVKLNHARHGDREAMIAADGRRSHGELSERAWAIARGLRERGVTPGDPVGLLAGNSVFFAEAFLGILAAGGIGVPYNWRWAAPELAHAIADSGARVVFAEQEFAQALEDANDIAERGDTVRVVYGGTDLEAFLRPGGAIDHHTHPEDTACILYTGGTTGRSKGVELSHRALLANAMNEIVDGRIATSADDRGLITTPLYHAAALGCWFVPHYIAGAASVLMREFDAAVSAELAESERITTIFLIPNMLRRLLRTGALETDGFQRHLRGLHTGGATLRMPDKDAIRAALPETDVYFRYGLTEAGPMVTRLQPRDIFDPAADGSIGKEYFLTEVQIQDREGSELAVGEVGEICVRGPNLMSRYRNRPEETEVALCRGWLHTGDLAERDERGFVFFRDRAKDMVKTGGENVYCAEVEQVLYTHPSILEAAVIGVPSTDWDEEVRAVVSVRPGAEMEAAELRGYVREHLAGYKVPKAVAFLDPDDMPINASGKVVKTRLRELAGW